MGKEINHLRLKAQLQSQAMSLKRDTIAAAENMRTHTHTHTWYGSGEPSDMHGRPSAFLPATITGNVKTI